MTRDSLRARVSRGHSERNDAAILKELGHSGQKGGPRSLPDLIERGTLDLELAAWLVSLVSRGASFIVGAGPSGAGKTTIVQALLSFAPGGLPFAMALPGKINSRDGVARCIIAHEISDHDSSVYLWGSDLRKFFALSRQGHMLVGTMHADGLGEVHDQICGSNGVSEARFRAINLFVFVGLEGAASSSRRVIRKVFYSDGAAAHKLVFTRDKGLSAGAPRVVDYEALCRKFLEETLARRPRTCEETRRVFLAWEKRHRRG
ncbi:MAG: hypothetical protein ABSA67_17790 [Candidatus Brocadiia bacterium]|jgi:hypothetical protein